MKKTILIATLALYSLTNFGQVINLGTAADFVLFTTTGAVSNTGISHVTGDVGTTAGAISGFSNIDGVNHNGDATSFNASTDLLTAYKQLHAAVPTFFPGPLLGYGQRFFAGVFSIPQAASLDDCLILDGQGDSNAVFIIQIQGTFSTGPSAKVRLINGALACNVFWKVEGAISMGAGTLMRGNLIANNGAIHMAAGDTLEGRAFSTTGAITIDGTLAFMPKGDGRAILTGPNAPALGSTINYSVFSSNGLVRDNGLTHLAGDVGTNLGSTSGYNPLNVAGTIHPIPDASTLLCSSDLLNIYNYLNALPSDIELLYPVQFGNKLVLTPHVYLMNAAAVLTDTLYLNAQGNANAVFVIKINGALTTSTYAKVKLINSAQSKNIFWLINGAATLNNYSVFRGTIICNNASIVLNVGASIDGSIFTTAGNITTTSDTIRDLNLTSTNLPGIICTCPILSTLPIELLSFTGEYYNQSIVLEWSTATEINNDYFEVLRSTNGISYEVLETINGGGNSTTMLAYDFTDSNPADGTNYYMLRQTDYDGQFEEYGPEVVDVLNAVDESMCVLTVYPNPCPGNCRAKLSECPKGSSEIRLMMTDATGHIINEIYAIRDYDGTFDIQIDTSNNLKPGLYIITTVVGEEKISEKLIVG